MKRIVLGFLACVLGIASVAGEVKLMDGTLLVGEVTEVFGKKLKVKTALCGELTIPQDKVISFTTDAPVTVCDKAGNRQTGTITAAGLQDESGKVSDFKAEDVKILWPAGGKDPSVVEAPQRKWTVEAMGDYTRKEGNTDKTDIGIGLRAILAGPIDKFQWYSSFKYGKENGVENDREMIHGADYERKFQAAPKNVWYVRGEYKYDKYGDLDPEITLGAGYGFYMLDRKDANVRFRIGLAYIHKSYISDMKDDDSIASDLNYHHEFQFQRMLMFDFAGTLTTDITLLSSFDDWMHDWHLRHESSLSFPLGGSKYWSIRLGILNDYYSKVAADKDRMDTTYFARLVLTYK